MSLGEYLGGRSRKIEVRSRGYGCYHEYRGRVRKQLRKELKE